MAYTQAQLNEALRRAGFQRTAGASDIRAANRFGLDVFARSRANVPQTTAGTTAATPDITQQFIDQLRPLFARPEQPAIAPFEGSGFYNEADTRALADQEYDPYFQRMTEDRERNNETERYGREQEVNAAGGFRSSAYQQELERRRLALERATGEQDTQKRLSKEQFTQGRRGEAYQRYLQSIGAVTQ